MIKRFVKYLLLAVGVYAMFGSCFALIMIACGEDKDDVVVETKKETTYVLDCPWGVGPFSNHIFEFDSKGHIVARKYTAILDRGQKIAYTAFENTVRIEIFSQWDNDYYYGAGNLYQGETNRNIAVYSTKITEEEYKKGISQ